MGLKSSKRFLKFFSETTKQNTYTHVFKLNLDFGRIFFSLTQKIMVDDRRANDFLSESTLKIPSPQFEDATGDSIWNIVPQIQEFQVLNLSCIFLVPFNTGVYGGNVLNYSETTKQMQSPIFC